MSLDVDALAEAGIRYAVRDQSIASITLAKPAARNAQDMSMTYALNDAFNAAAHDDTVKVIVLRAEGPHFSAGHDMSGDHGKTWRDFTTVGTWASFDAPGVEGRWGREQEIYMGMCERWRNIPKPTIAAVQGSCIAGGLMLAWSCDLIVATASARFMDPTLEFGVSGVEYFMHPMEFGPRKAKEMLFMSDWISATEAASSGMVNRVVPDGELDDVVFGMARKIARKSSFVLKATKESVNFYQDAAGRRQTLANALSVHQMTHAHNELLFDFLIDPNGLPPAVRDKILVRIERTRAERKAQQVAR